MKKKKRCSVEIEKKTAEEEKSLERGGRRDDLEFAREVARRHPERILLNRSNPPQTYEETPESREREKQKRKRGEEAEKERRRRRDKRHKAGSVSVGGCHEGESTDRHT